MTAQISISEFLNSRTNIPVVDVRTPAEFIQAHIPEAINIPLFSNEERAIVGTIYKQNGKNQAVIKGLEFAAPKLAPFVKQAIKLKTDQLLMYCWRGGMRSGSMAWLFETAGIKVKTLYGGYKSYRNHVLNSFQEPLKLIVLGGFTGAGKTDILNALEQNGEQILDLEALANHKGSAFGALGQKKQPTVEMFENMLFDKISCLDKSKHIWIEDEGKNIGRVNICNTIWTQLRTAPVVIADTNRNIRLDRLVKDYACFSKEELAISIKRIEKRLGYDHCQKALQECEKGNFRTVAEICLTYYDKAYNLQLSTRLGEHYKNTPPVNTDTINTDTIEKLKQTAKQIYGTAKP